MFYNELLNKIFAYKSNSNNDDISETEIGIVGLSNEYNKLSDERSISVLKLDSVLLVEKLYNQYTEIDGSIL